MKKNVNKKMIKSNKIYDYKIWEQNNSYFVTDYAEKETIYENSSFSSVQDFVDELESKIDNYTYGGIKEIW